jgi:hypothetical protein
MLLSPIGTSLDWRDSDMEGWNSNHLKDVISDILFNFPLSPPL